MKLSLTFLVTVLLVASLHLDDSEAWRIRIRLRRILRVVKPIVCPWACKLVCSSPGFCHPVCGKFCSSVGKRDAELEKSIPFPANFDEYDKDRNGEISLAEFAKTINSTKELSAPAFELADENSDGKLDQEEFENGPFITTDDVPESERIEDKGPESNNARINETEIEFDEEDMEELLSEK